MQVLGTYVVLLMSWLASQSLTAACEPGGLYSSLLSTLRVELRVCIDTPGEDWPDNCGEAVRRLFDPATLVHDMEPEMRLIVEPIKKCK